MKPLKADSWFLFYVIASVWVGGFLMASIWSVKNTFDEYSLEQSHLTSVSASSISARFGQYEALIDVLAKEIANKEMLQPEELQREIDLLLDFDPSLTSIAAFKPDGDLFLVSSNVSVGDGYNILTRDDVRDSFLYTLTMDTVVVGRTYYNDVLDSLIIPVRKSVRNAAGEVEFVVSAAVNLDNAFGFFASSSQSDMGHYSYVLRELDSFYQIAPKELYKNYEVYNQALEEKRVLESRQDLAAYFNDSYESMKQRTAVFSWVIDQPDQHALLSSIFLERYAFWVTTELDMKWVYGAMIRDVLVLFCLFSISLGIIYRLFQFIRHSEVDRSRSLKQQAVHDYLTGLKNRFHLAQRYESLEQEPAFWLLFIDLDNFKAINDTYGHHCGDELLRVVSDRLRVLANISEEVIRYSGDEFIVISRRVSRTSIREFGESILDILNQPIAACGVNIRITSSIGVAHFPSDAHSFDEVKRYADFAMYKSKERRGVLTFFENDMKEKYLANARVENMLQDALDNKEFFLVYQPQVSASGQLCGVEALLRWVSPTLGFIPPDQFIPIAEQKGLMPAIGQFVICQAIKDISQLNNKLGLEIALSVNVSVTQFSQEDFIDKLTWAMRQAAKAKVNLKAEITESTFIDDVETTHRMLIQLKQLGIRISLDDFGTGFSSLSLLRKLPIDELKIDKSFVDEMLEDDDAYSMVEQVITLGKKLGMVLVAEGVETEEQHDALSHLCCDMFQGYHFSKPLILQDLYEFAEKGIVWQGRLPQV